LHCFQGFCASDDGSHTAAHYGKLPSHGLFLHIEKTAKEHSHSDKQKAKITRLEVSAEPGEQDLCATSYSVYCAQCKEFAELGATSADVQKLAGSVINSASAAFIVARNGGDSWVEPAAQPCEHGLLLEVSDVSRSSSAACSQCDLKQNLWLCLSCGALNCGRRQFDGSGGNGHALSHYQSCMHPLACKLGTITADGDADVYCYACDDMVVDVNLKEHLATFGIDLASARKTEQSTAEMQLSVNLTHTYAMVDKEGNELKPVSVAPGYRGLTNLGNSCYLATVVQALRNVPESIFKLKQNHDYLECNYPNPADCIQCQVLKLARGFYQQSSNEEELRPWMFKSLIGQGHADFSSASQQDAAEFLAHLLNRLAKNNSYRPFVKTFEFEQVQRLTCKGCGLMRRSCARASALSLNVAPLLLDETTSISIKSLFDLYFAAEDVEIKCPQCSASLASREVRLGVLPRNLIVTVNRFRLRNWVPEKSDCVIDVDAEEPLDLSIYMVSPEEGAVSSSDSNVRADPELLGELLLLGLEEEVARKALISCNNSSIEEAMQTIFGSDKTETMVDEGAMDLLTSAGFDAEAAKQALLACDNDSERAFDHLLSHPNQAGTHPDPITKEDSITCPLYRLNSFITHRGASMHCGHYVAHLRDEEKARWVLYNDDKVAEAATPLSTGEAYIYVYANMQ